MKLHFVKCSFQNYVLYCSVYLVTHLALLYIEHSQKHDEHNIYVIMKTMCPHSYHHTDFMATHALGYMMYGYTLLAPMNQRVLNKSIIYVVISVP